MEVAEDGDRGDALVEAEGRGGMAVGLAEERLLCAGPGRLCQALGVTGAHYGLALDEPPFQIFARTQAVDVTVGPRIGLTKAVDQPWRYGLKGSRFLSKPFKR